MRIGTDVRGPSTSEHKHRFNLTNSSLSVAPWTWDPVTGCKRGCPYCYAREIASRCYAEGFEPRFRPEQLDAPQNTPVPPGTEARDVCVFVCPMADLFGEWVPQEWIDAVLKAAGDAPQWEFLFLTKNPERLVELSWPGNAWVGATIDRQDRVDATLRALSQVRAAIRWIACEPLQERLVITAEQFEELDWLVLGGWSRSSGAGKPRPWLSWIRTLEDAASEAGCPVYHKPNLQPRREEPIPLLGRLDEVRRA